MIKKTLKKLINFFFFDAAWPKMVDALVPKDKTMYLFGSYLAKYFEDNSWYLFDYVCKHRKDLHPVWITKNRDIVKEISATYGPDKVVYGYSLKGIGVLLRAYAVFVSYTIVHDIPMSFLVSRKKVVVNLWHSVMIKGLFLTNSEWTDSFRRYYLRKIEPRYTGFITSSKQEQLTLTASFGAFLNKMPITGYPRNDYLVRYSTGEWSGKKILDLVPNKNIGPVKKIILYAPTKREDHLPKIFPFADFDLDQLQDFLERNQILLILRAHKSNFITEAYTKPLTFDDLKRHPRIQVLNTDKVKNLTDILWNVDILVTDYSGVYFDFLLLDRPMIFVPYDIDTYSAKPGLIMNYDLMTPGPKVKTFADFCQWVDRYNQDPKMDGEKRLFLKNLFHEVDGRGSCDRVLEYVKKIRDGKSIPMHERYQEMKRTA